MTPKLAQGPGEKKSADGYSKQITPEKIVNEQDQEKVSNAPGMPDTNVESSTDATKNQATENAPNSSEKDHSNEHLSERVTEEADHITEETKEEDRKQEAGINP